MFNVLSVTRELDELLMNSSVVENALYKRKGNIVKNDEDYKVNLALPGFQKEDLQINFEKDSLKVSADIEKEKHTEFVMSFSETLRISPDIDASKIKAKFENGILEITLPILKDRKPQKVKIE